ncbi:MAG: hypothetical protein H6831_04920 [Planctomycetes bacterium]|nr:hypothetical protein [Planctomycetota bacterium]MCB9903731.1 hypothetical protein [Planctomycetota bacterium]
MSGKGVVSKRRRVARICLRAVVLGTVAFVAWIFWLSLDRSPRILERHGTLEGFSSGPELAVGDHLDQDLLLLSSSGLEVELLVRRPAGVTDPAPLVLLLGGLNTGKAAARLVEANRPVVVAALSYPTELRKIGTDLGLFADVAEARRAILDTPAAVMLALDHLVEQPFVDASRIELVGVSLGAPFAVVAGAMDPRVRRVWSIHGGGDPTAMIAKGLEPHVSFGPARWAVANLAARLAHASSIAPERWVGRIAPRPFVMVNAEHDERIPRACVDALYEAAGEPRELIWDPGAHIDVDREARLRGLTELVLSRIER